MPAPAENQNAAKPAGEQHTSFIYVRLTAAEKIGYARAANREKKGLAAWAREKLTAACPPPVPPA